MLMVLLDLLTVSLFWMMLRLCWRTAAWGFRQPSRGWMRARFVMGAVGVAGAGLYCAAILALLVSQYVLLIVATY